MNLFLVFLTARKAPFVLFGLCLVTLVPILGHALEPKNPETLCERFIDHRQKEDCLAEMKKVQPDWYLASLCEKIFDNAQFYSCLEMSSKADFSPESLQACDNDENNDQETLNCIHQQARNGNSYQDLKIQTRKPSSVSPKKTPRAKLPRSLPPKAKPH